MGLSSTIFVLWPKEVICWVRSCGSVYGFGLQTYVLPSDLCAWMFGWLWTKIRKASKMEVGVLVDWEPWFLELRIFTKCDHVRKGKTDLLVEGQASVARYNRWRAAPVTLWVIMCEWATLIIVQSNTYVMFLFLVKLFCFI